MSSSPRSLSQFPHARRPHASSREAESQEALRRYDILDTPPEDAFDRIADVAAHLFNAGIALVSLIDHDKDRQWFKACLGLDTRETGLDVSFCIYAVQADETLVVEDATDDERFADNPLVTGGPGIRFYAGAPLRTPEGQVLGTLCVIDTETRTGDAAPTAGQIEQLENLAAMVVDELELRRVAAERQESARALERERDLLQNVFDTTVAAIVVLDAEGRIIRANEWSQDVLGASADEVVGRTFNDPAWRITDPQGHALPDDALPFRRVMDTEAPVRDVELAIEWPNGERRILSVNGAPLRDDEGAVRWAVLVVEDVTERRRAETAEQRFGRLLRAAHGEIYVFDADTLQFVQVNDGAQANLGYTEAELQSMTPADLKPDTADELAERFRPLVDGATDQVSFETTHRRADGSTYPVQVRVQLSRHETPPVFIAIVLDITERKAAERELRQNRERWQRLVEAHRDPIMISVDGAIEYVNPAGAELFAADSPADIIGRSIFDFTVGDDADDRFHDRIEQIQRGEPTAPLEHKIERLDGERRIIQAYSVPIEYNGTTAAQTVLRDITQEREAERSLRESEERYRSLAEQTSDLITRHAPDGTILYASPAAERILGYAPDDLVGRDPYAIIHPDDRERARADHAWVLRGERTRSELRYLHKDGFPMWMETIGTLDRSVGPEPGMIVSSRPIAKRKEKERELRMLSEVVEQATEAMLITQADASASGDQVIVYVNPAFERITGYTADEAIGQTPRLLRGPKTDRAVLDGLQDALDAGRSWEGETINYRKDGSEYRVHWTASPVRSEDGSIEYWASVQRDVTEERQREAELRRHRDLLGQTQKLAGAWEADLRTHTMSWSKEIYRIHEVPVGTNITVEEAIDFYAPEARPILRDAYERCVEHGDTWDLELPLITANGHRRWVRTVGEAVTVEDGEVTELAGAFQDITERRQAKQALQEQRERLEMALVGGNIGMWDWDMRTNEVVYDDERLTAILGYTLDEVDFDNTFFERHTHPEDLERVYANIERHADGELPYLDQEIRIQAKDGSWRWVLDRGKIVERDDDGTPLRMVGTHLDITDRKRAEEELRHERNVLQRIFDASPAAIVMLDAEGAFTFASAQAEDVLGLEPSAISGRTYDDPEWQIEAPDGSSMSASELPFAIVRHTGEPVHKIEHAIRWPDGTRRLLSASGAPLNDEDGTFEGAVFVLTDITERKRAEDALRESEAQLRGLANSVPGVIFQFFARPARDDARTGGPDALRPWTYGLRFVSEQAAPVLGLDATADGFFERFAAHVPDSHRDAFYDSVRDAIERSGAWNFEMPFEKPGGEQVWIQGLSTPEKHNGDRVWSGVLLDVTQRKQLESQLRQAQKMETVGTLAGGIAHDFNNILHATEAYLALLEDSIPEDHPDRMLLDRAAVGLGRASELVKKLLTFSRQEGKTVEKQVDLADVLTETLDLTKPSISKHVTLRTHVASESRVLGDPGQLQQVALNLITNAAQAMQHKASPSSQSILDVDVRPVTVGEDLAARRLNLEPGPYVRLTVSDTGTGMTAETQERIFEPFFTTKDVGEGTGLGLPVVHGIVQAHDGEITVVSEEGEGTTFTVFLPALDEEVPSAPDAPDPRPGHVLLVDDDEQVLELEAMRLGRLGYGVTTHSSADAALTAVREHPDAYDLVITDYAMPGTHGLALIERLRAGDFEPPILLMSGFSASVSTDDVTAAGAQAFLRKPVGTRELRSTLARLLSDAEDAPAGANTGA